MTSLANLMDSPHPPTSPSTGRRLILRLAMTLAAAALGALLFALVRMVNFSIQPWALSLATAAGLGLLSGLYARVSLRMQTAALPFLVGVVSLVAALVFLGWMTWGMCGITLGQPREALPDWYGLSQLALGMLGVALAQEAWRDRRRPSETNRPASVDEPPRPAQASGASTAGPASAHVGQTPRPRAGALAPLGAAWRRLGGRPRRAHVRLRGAAEHRCPYCLDPITRRDPRGVVVCPVCRTPHHADCWAVTGMCQVPHHHR
jgi:ribosomal protein L37AE/L43A